MRSINIVLLVFLGIQSMLGQGGLSISMESTYLEYQQIDLSDNDLFFEFDEGLKNNGDENVSVGWSISKVKGCPSEWELKVVDKYSDYIIRPNYKYSYAIEVGPAEYSSFNIVMLPKGVSGSCSFRVKFFDADNPNTIFDNAEYELRVNGNDIESRSTAKEKDIEIFQVYPNPSINVINIKSKFTFDSGQIYSSEGQLVMNISANQKEIRVEDLKAGVYRIVLDYSSKRKGTSTFIKIQ